MSNEVYNSATFGPIPLSFTGRRLLANLREEVLAYVESGDSIRLSFARGAIAKYMSDLEGKSAWQASEDVRPSLGRFTNQELMAELGVRMDAILNVDTLSEG